MDSVTVLSLVVNGVLGATLVYDVLRARVRSSRHRTERHVVEQRLDRIEHMLSSPDQAWYWTPEWQAGETEADADLAAERGTVHLSEDEFFAALDAVPVSESSRSGAHGA